jgi:hypothetical protein
MGFEVYENLGFALAGDYNLYLLILRSITSLAGHIPWAAMMGAGLAIAKGKDKLQAKHFVNAHFLKYFTIGYALHTAWNHPFGDGILVIPFTAFIGIKQVLLTVICWVILLRLIKQGVTECMRIPQTASVQQNVKQSNAPESGALSAPPYAAPQSLCLRGIAGVYNGSVFPASQGKLVIGRDAKRANLVYPPDTPGISSIHCEIRNENGTFVLIDKNSSNGTFFADGTRLTPNQPYPIARKSGFYLASRENMFELD